MPAVVEKDQLSKANGNLFAAEVVMNQFAGPPLGGVLVAVSAALALATGAGLYAVAAVGLAMLPGTYRTTPARPPRCGTTSPKASGTSSPPAPCARSLLLGALNLVFMAQTAVFVLYATSDEYGLGLSDAGVGVLLSVGALGWLLGSLVAGPVEAKLGRSRVLAVSVAFGSVALLVPGLTRNAVLVAASGLLTGAFSIWNVITVSLRQRTIPDHLLGRVNSAYRLLGWGSMPIGAALGGAVAEWLSVRAVFLLAGAITLLLLVPLRLVITDKAIEEAEAAVPSTDAPTAL